MGIGSNIRVRREHSGLTQKELAEKMGVQQTYVSYLEVGTKIPTLANASKLSEIFHCKIDDLLADDTRLC